MSLSARSRSELCRTETDVRVPRATIVPLSFKMFEFNMDEYLDEETDWVKDAMAKICKEWDQRVSLARLHLSRCRSN